MGKITFFVIIIASLCVGQTEKENFVAKDHEVNSNKHLFFEFLGCAYLTLEHEIIFGGVHLPYYMWGGSGGISYHFNPHMAVSCASGYSYTTDLSYPAVDYGSSEMKFSNRSFAFLFSYKNANITIGTGIDISFIVISRKDWVIFEPNDTLISFSTHRTRCVRPLVNASAQHYIICPVYLKIQMESRILHFVNIGSKEIHLLKVQPSICIGLGYIFNL